MHSAAIDLSRRFISTTVVRVYRFGVLVLLSTRDDEDEVMKHVVLWVVSI